MTTSPGDGTNLFVNENNLVRTEVWYAKQIASYGIAPSPLTAKAWHHVVMTHAANPYKDLLYVDGVVATDSKTFAVARPTTTRPLALTGFVGAVDEIAFYDHALAPERVAAHYAAQ